MSQEHPSNIHDTSYPLMEQFYTLQGEGSHFGRAAYFLRLGGCDVGCVWCDVKESWDANAHPKQTVGQMCEAISTSGANRVIVTGGEPAMHQLDALTKALKELGVKRHIETSGAHPLTGDWDWICLSPKKFKAARPEVFKQAHELKVVVYNKHDLKWAEEQAAHVSPTCELFLQPEWDRREESEPLILDYIRENPQWRISMQIHKVLGVL